MEKLKNQGRCSVMLFKASELEKVVMEKPRGGVGKVEGLYAFQMGKAPDGGVFQVAAHQTLQPGCSFGYHQHVDNEELYVFLSGQGTFTDSDKQEKQIGPGDMTLTLKGESHGLVNTGSEPLIFLAVIAKK
jgi:mannose-6-phosphate isomerase-like protein (cupin superfamily)